MTDPSGDSAKTLLVMRRTSDRTLVAACEEEMGAGVEPDTAGVVEIGIGAESLVEDEGAPPLYSI